MFVALGSATPCLTIVWKSPPLHFPGENSLAKPLFPGPFLADKHLCDRPTYAVVVVSCVLVFHTAPIPGKFSHSLPSWGPVRKSSCNLGTRLPFCTRRAALTWEEQALSMVSQSTLVSVSQLFLSSFSFHSTAERYLSSVVCAPRSCCSPALRLAVPVCCFFSAGSSMCACAWMSSCVLVVGNVFQVAWWCWWRLWWCCRLKDDVLRWSIRLLSKFSWLPLVGHSNTATAVFLMADSLQVQSSNHQPNSNCFFEIEKADACSGMG